LQAIVQHGSSPGIGELVTWTVELPRLGVGAQRTSEVRADRRERAYPPTVVEQDALHLIGAKADRAPRRKRTDRGDGSPGSTVGNERLRRLRRTISLHSPIYRGADNRCGGGDCCRTKDSPPRKPSRVPRDVAETWSSSAAVVPGYTRSSRPHQPTSSMSLPRT
jgi:hypothetical protein